MNDKARFHNNKTEKRGYPELIPLWIAVFIDILGFYIIIPFLPTFIKIYNTTPLMIGLLLATNAIFTFISAPIWGKLSDKFGRKPILIISQMGTLSAFLILAFSNSLELLFLSRVVDGIFGGNFPIVKAIISDSVPPKDRGLQMTNMGVVHTLAGLIGPGLGGILSIFKPFGPNFPIAAPGLAAAGLSLSTIIITLIFVQESWPKIKRQRMDKEIKIKIKLKENKDTSYLLTLYVFHAISFTTYVTTLTIFIALVFGFDAIGVALLLTISGITRAIVRFTLFKPTVKLLGEDKMTKLGLFIIVITFFLAGFVRDVLSFVILICFVSYGVSCSRGLLISKITQSVTPKEMGKINGYTTAIDSLAQIGGPLVGTFILTAYSPELWGLVISIAALIAFIMIFKEITPLMGKEHLEKDDLEKKN